MTNLIEIGGKKRPVRFNMAGLREYEQQTGGNCIALFNDLAVMAPTVSISTITDLVYYGIKAGYNKAGEEIDFDENDVAEWIGETPGLLEKVVTSYREAFMMGMAVGKAATAKLPLKKMNHPK